VLLRLATGLDRGEFEVEAAGLRGRGAVADALRATGVPVHDVGLGAGLLRLLRERRFDVVHASLFHASLWARIATTLARPGPRPRPAIVCALHAIESRAPFRLLIDRATAGLVDRYVAVSEAVRRFAIGRGGLPARRVATVRNGVDLPPARPGPPPSPGEGPFVCVARLHRDKDHATLLRAWALVRARLGATTPALELAGDGPLRAPLEALAAALGLGAVVRFLGARGDVPAVLGRAAAFVLATRREGLGLAAIEAMAASLPVVAAGAGGIAEAVVQGETGLLVRPGAASALAAAVLALVADPDRARRLGEAGRRRAEREFSAPVMVRRYASLYRDVAGLAALRRSAILPA